LTQKIHSHRQADESQRQADESLAAKIRPFEQEIRQNTLFFNNPACFAENAVVFDIR
jgi:hypothetical protein